MGRTDVLICDAKFPNSSQVVNGLLEKLDGAQERTGVVVLGATNLVDRIDPAILRPGRLDRVVRIELPDAAGLVGIIRSLLGKELEDDNLMPMVSAGRGASGADASAWVRRARGIARRAGRKLELADLLAAAGEGRDVLSTEDRWRAAVHEAGHACAATALKLGTVLELTLHGAGGTKTISSSASILTLDVAMAGIVQLLAGREAERLVFGQVSAGAGGLPHSDLSQAMQTALAIESSWGLGRLGPVWLQSPGISKGGVPELVFVSVVNLLHHAEREAARLVTANVQALRRCASRLNEEGRLGEAAILESLGRVKAFTLKTLERKDDIAA